MSGCWLFWTRLSLASGIILSGVFNINAVQAQITSDGTLPTPTDVTDNGNVTEITGGTVEGSNLFHSFQDFSVGTGGTADFLNADSISNIFSRVTGGNPSNIDGLIRTNNASLFFLNPAGIIFGAGASLDLGGGSFYGTTADSLLFEDGEFIASNTDTTPILSINAPIGLGFRDDPADITLAGNENAVDLIDFAFLSVEDNQSINLIGGNLNLSDAILLAPGGRVELGGLAAAGTVDINEDGSLDFPDNLALGDISLDNFGVFVVFSEDGEGGSINFNANDLNILDASILQSGIDGNSGFTEAQSGDINLNATGAINISELSRIQNQVSSGGTGSAGNININANSLSLSEQADIVSSTFGQGNAGNITIDTEDGIELSNSDISSLVGTEAEGNGGNINISGNSFALKDGAFLESSTFGQGDSGQIQITTDGVVELAEDSEIFNNVERGAVGDSLGIIIDAQSLDVTGGSQIQTLVRGSTDDNPEFGQGNAGDININVRDTVSFSGFSVDEAGNPLFFSQASSELGTGATGSGGNINIQANSLSLSDGAFLESSTSGVGDSGQIQITTEGAVELAGDSEIFNNVERGAVGDSLGINIDAQSLDVTGGSQIQTLVRGSTDENPNFGEGNAGDININVRDTVSFSGFSENSEGTIFPSTARSFLGTDATGSAGNINITAKSVSLSEQADIDSSTFGQGNAGNITLDTEDSVELSNSDISNLVGSDAEGNGGDISIEANAFSLKNNSFLNSSTNGQGNSGQIQITTEGAVELAGDSEIFNNVEQGALGDSLGITIDAQSLEVTGGSQIQTLVRGSTENNPEFGEGNAGDININVRDTVSFSGSSVDNEGNPLFSRASSQLQTNAVGNAGNINISANTFSLEQGALIDSITSGQGNAGNINLDLADSLSLTDGASISSSTFGQGNGGNISIQAVNDIILDGFITLDNIPVFSVISTGVSFDIVSEVAGNGKGGDIDINARSLSLNNGALIDSSTFGQGNAGNIDINVSDTLTLSGLVRTESQGVEQDFSSGIGSQVGSIFISNQAEGNAGDITIQAGSISMDDNSTIATGTSGIGNAGNITIDVTDSITLTNQSDIRSNVEIEGVGDGGDINIEAKTLTLEEGGTITAGVFREGLGFTGGQGKAGNINIETSDSIKITGVFLDEVLTQNPGNPTDNFVQTGFSSGIVVSTERGANGSSGNINLTTKDFAVADGGIVSAITANQGSGGNITINANTLDATGGGQILTTAFAQGNAGNINLNIADSINISGRDANFANRLSVVEASLEGLSGILVEDIVNNQGAESGIFANTDSGSTGEGGSITIGDNIKPVEDVFLADEGRIAANSDGAGDGGNIVFFISDRLQLSGDSIISARSSTSNGGNIIINADDGFLIAFPSPNNSQGNDIVADAQGGTGGNITIRTQGVLGLEEGRAANNNGSNDIDASGQTNGVVEIITPDVDAIQGAAELPTNPVEPDTSVAQTCSADKIAQGSSLTVNGKGGIPPLPIEPLSSDLVLAQNPQATQHESIKPISTSIGDIFPARGVIVHEDGTFDLVAYATENQQRQVVPQTSCGKRAANHN